MRRGRVGGYEDNEDVEIDNFVLKSDNPAKNAIAIWTGLYTEAGGLSQEKWIWLPRAHIELSTDKKGLLVKRWLAEKEGLV